jgi:hypothetical protein
MLVYALAIAVILGSLTFYLAAFFFPEVHRRNDFIWSGVGMFYALVLWLCAGRITGGVLLGQVASVTLLGWLGWQTLSLRRAKAPTEAKTEVSEATTAQTKNKLFGGITGLFRKSKKQPTGDTKPESVAELVDDEEPQETEPQAEAAPDVETQPEAEAAPDIETQPEAEADTNWPDEDVSNWPDDEEEITTTTVLETASTDADAISPTDFLETPASSEFEAAATAPEAPAPEAVEAAQSEPEVPEIALEDTAPEAELAPPAEDPSSHDAPAATETTLSEDTPEDRQT